MNNPLPHRLCATEPVSAVSEHEAKPPLPYHSVQKINPRLPRTLTSRYHLVVGHLWWVFFVPVDNVVIRENHNVTFTFALLKNTKEVTWKSKFAILEQSREYGSFDPRL